MLSARLGIWNEPLTQVKARRQIGRPSQLVFIYFSWQPLQAARNCPISLLELIQAFGVASFLGELRGDRGALVEIRKVHPESGEAYVSVAGSRSAPGFHGLVPAGNMCGNDINMIEMVSAC